MPDKLNIQDLDLRGKKVLIRVDYNVPLENSKITDDTRIRETLPTIQYTLDRGGIPILMSHLGRPKGQPDPHLSLAPCANRLSELLKKPVKMASDCCGGEVEKLVSRLKSGDIVLLENLRFHVGEENPSKEPSFVSALAKLGDVYVDDAFGCAHRPHASIVEITDFFPDRSAAGFLMQKELTYLGSTLLNPKRPFYAVLGGAKISTKFRVLESLMQKADVLLIGGAMANTFLKSEEVEIGDSLFERDFIPVARELLDVSIQPHCRIILPVDLVVADAINSKANTKIVSVSEGVPKGYKAVDIGPQTVQRYSDELQKAATVFWNGPLGIFECAPFAKGTNGIAKTVANLSSAITIVGGGDSIAAIEQFGLTDQITHISTGGGASLEFIEFGTLPGIEALSNKKVNNVLVGTDNK
jgi:phosphoglycerate kinase